MHKSHSNSEASWLYTRPAFGRQGRSLAENNFQKERRDWLAVLLREVLQNGLDAKDEAQTSVHVRLARVAVSQDFSKVLLPDQHLERLRHSLPHLHGEAERPDSYLVIEDFGTTGLTGSLKNPDLDGHGENWNAFWFREGEGGKEVSSGNGGAGQGKITYFSTSSVRTIFAYTVRVEDKVGAVFGASSFLREYGFGTHKWLRDSYWGHHIERDDGEQIAVPVTAAQEVQRFREALGLTRSPDQPGLSLVIPGPKEFKDTDAIEIVTAEFFAAIIRGHLSVQIGEICINRENVAELADQFLSDTRAMELHTCMTSGFRVFFADALEASHTGAIVSAPRLADIKSLAVDTFSSSVLEALRESFTNSERIGVRFSLQVKPKTSAPVECTFDVHLAYSDELHQAEQAVLRRDLLIGEEPIGGGRIRQKVRSVTIIPNSQLSRLLLCAEEPTHLRWNTRLPRLGEYFKTGADAVSFVRNAAAKLVDLLSSGDQRRDFKLLAKYFSAPGTFTSKMAKGKKARDGKSIPVPPILPPPKPALILIEPLVDGCLVRPTEMLLNGTGVLPLNVTLEFAYEGLDRDAFAEYDPLDFDLSDKVFNIDAVGCVVTDSNLNRIEYRVNEREFSLTVRGFDPNLRLRMRLNYAENQDAETIET